MTCIQCRSDTADRDEYVVYGGVIFCDFDCLAAFYFEREDRFIRNGKTPEYVEAEAKVVEP